MSKRSEGILREAMAMSTAERAELAQKLVASLEPRSDGDVEQAWQEECKRRLQDSRRGDVQFVPWEELRDRLREAGRASG